MADLQNFAESTRLFNESRFVQGFDQIDRCIAIWPETSLLYSNRAIFLVEIGHIRQAIKDLKYSICLDYLNYISYFNLFSIYVRQGNLDRAAHNLYCALSAIYLIAAKDTKSYDYIVKSVQYAKNNTEARVLKGLMEMELGKFKEAHEELVWACGIETDNIMLAKVRDLIKKIGDQTAKDHDEEGSSSSSFKDQTKRLESAFDPDQFTDIEAEIRDRVFEFNQIYSIVGQKQDLITQKMVKRDIKKKVFIRQKSRNSQHERKEKTDSQKEGNYSEEEVKELKLIENLSQTMMDQVIKSMFQ